MSLAEVRVMLLASRVEDVDLPSVFVISVDDFLRSVFPSSSRLEVLIAWAARMLMF